MIFDFLPISWLLCKLKLSYILFSKHGSYLADDCAWISKSSAGACNLMTILWCISLCGYQIQHSLIILIICCIKIFVHKRLQIQYYAALTGKKPLMLSTLASTEEMKVYNLIKNLLEWRESATKCIYLILPLCCLVKTTCTSSGAQLITPWFISRGKSCK